MPLPLFLTRSKFLLLHHPPSLTHCAHTASQLYDTSDEATKATDDAANAAINAAAKTEVASGDEQYIYSPAETARNRTGVTALEWTRDGVTVLAFRGSVTTGDRANIENWFLDFVLERSTARMKQAWTTDAKLPWTDTMQERHDRGDLFARTAIRTLEVYTDGSPDSGEFAPELATAVRESADASLAALGLDEAAAKATGYWALTKKMVDDVVDALPAGQVRAG